MRALLSGICGLTIVASVWLGLMSIVLHRPGFAQLSLLAALFLLQSVFVLALTNGWLPGLVWRAISIAGAAGLIWSGARALVENLSSKHFEGYALVIGVLLVAQGLLTLLTPSSKVHQFGN